MNQPQPRGLTHGLRVRPTGCCAQDTQGAGEAAGGTGDTSLNTAEAEAAALALSVDAFEVRPWSWLLWSSCLFCLARHHSRSAGERGTGRGRLLEPWLTAFPRSRGASPQEEGGDLAPEMDARALVTSVTTAVNDRPVVRGVLLSGAAFLGATFLFSCYKVFLRFNSSRSKRRRQVGKNLVVVDALAKYLPGQRDRLSPAVVRALSVRTGFSRDSVFRKHLRYMLAERPFDNDAFLDVVALRDACGLSDAQLAEVLLDTAERSRKQTGVLMRKPSGMTAEGLARKAQGRALFSKLLFLCEHESLLTSPGEREAAAAALCKTFGATADDADALRIPSLSGLTPEDLERLWGGSGGGGAEGEEGKGDSSADE